MSLFPFSMNQRGYDRRSNFTDYDQGYGKHHFHAFDVCVYRLMLGLGFSFL